MAKQVRGADAEEAMSTIKMYNKDGELVFIGKNARLSDDELEDIGVATGELYEPPTADDGWTSEGIKHN